MAVRLQRRGQPMQLRPSLVVVVVLGSLALAGQQALPRGAPVEATSSSVPVADPRAEQGEEEEDDATEPDARKPKPPSVAAAGCMATNGAGTADALTSAVTVLALALARLARARRRRPDAGA